jgi:hypothetical protein
VRFGARRTRAADRRRPTTRPSSPQFTSARRYPIQHETIDFITVNQAGTEGNINTKAKDGADTTKVQKVDGEWLIVWEEDSGDETTTTAGESGDRPISRADYESVKVGDDIDSLIARFGEPDSIVRGREISRDLDDTYSWDQDGGGLLDKYTFDVDPSTKRVTTKAIY